MNRKETLENIKLIDQWDLVVIGGGATGLGEALEASTRGLKVLLLEKYDFGKGTSSRSTKIFHGGVRYLQNFQLGLVKEALQERIILNKISQGSVFTQEFVIPVYSIFDLVYYFIGLSFYNFLAGRKSLGKTRFLSVANIIKSFSNIETNQDGKYLRGGIVYTDAQFDDTRFLIQLAKTASQNGAALLNYAHVVSFSYVNKYQESPISGIVFTDVFTGENFSIKTKSLINATGVFSDSIIRLDNPLHKNYIKPSKGVHIVVDTKFFSKKFALMIPNTSDGRVIFALPWKNKVIVGTTDTAEHIISEEPEINNDDINLILNNINRYIKIPITRSDITSAYAGLRPLISLVDNNEKNTANISREYKIIISPNNLISVLGGKWTIYRVMSRKVVDKAIEVAKLKSSKSLTHKLFLVQDELANPNDDRNDKKISTSFSYTWTDIYNAIHYEMAMTLEDIVFRRTRMCTLDYLETLKQLTPIAKYMAKELGRDHSWVEEQVQGVEKSIKKIINLY